MALKTKYPNKDSIPPEHAPLYVERNGAWLLDTDEVADTAGLDDLRNSNAQLQQERDALQKRLEVLQIDQGAILAARPRGLRSTAERDLTARARQNFILVNGVPTVVDTDGKSPRKSKDGKALMSMDEWVEAQLSEAPHLFDGNVGSGAAGNRTAPAQAYTGPNPYHPATENITEQWRMEKESPELATAMQAAAKTAPQTPRV